MLLENAPGIDSELEAPGNQGIQGLNIVDDIKSAVEKACPRTVSCADILTIASKESVVLVSCISLKLFPFLFIWSLNFHFFFF